jgi:hypothetical protein
MAAVDGDGTPWSYLCASLAVRQLIDFGAWDHGVLKHDWAQHRVVARWPQIQPSPWRLEAGATLAAERPCVTVDSDSVTARFYTHCPPWAKAESVWRHEDRYRAGSFDPLMTRTLLAIGRPGRFSI